MVPRIKKKYTSSTAPSHQARDSPPPPPSSSPLAEKDGVFPRKQTTQPSADTRCPTSPGRGYPDVGDGTDLFDRESSLGGKEEVKKRHRAGSVRSWTGCGGVSDLVAFSY
jgi:hypothetical protein